jgi:hypothetical protein
MTGGAPQGEARGAVALMSRAHAFWRVHGTRPCMRAYLDEARYGRALAMEQTEQRSAKVDMRTCAALRLSPRVTHRTG